MIPSVTFWLLLMFQPEGAVSLVSTYRTEEACLQALSTAPKDASAFCVQSKATPPKRQ
jgi:hypothetical protein